MDITLIQSAIAGLKTASDIAKGILDLKITTEVGGKVAELQNVILTAQESAFAANAAQSEMAEEIRALKDEMVRIKAWEAQKNRYQMESPWAGAVVYALKDSMKGTEPHHWICAQCYEDGKRSILQYRPKPGEKARYVCSCGFAIQCLHRGIWEIKYSNS